MGLNWIESILFGFFAGLADILPVSAEGHRMLFFSQESEPIMLRLLVHIGVAAGLYVSCHNHILRIIRAYKLSQIPKRRRKRPLDASGLMDLRLIRTMVIPFVIGLFFYDRLSGLVTGLNTLPFSFFVNGLILFIPQFLPGSNKESLSMTPLDGVLLGIVAVASMIPGISWMAVIISVALIRGADKAYALSIALLFGIAVNVSLVLFDFIAIFQGAAAGLSFTAILRSLLAALAAFGGAWSGVKIMRKLASNLGFTLFAYYCWGAALFSFILFLSI